MLAEYLNIPGWVAAFVGLIGLVGTIAAAVAVARQYAIKESLAQIIVANDELRHTNNDLRQRLAESEKATAAQGAKLELFTSHFAEQIVHAVVETVQRTQALVGIPARDPNSRTRQGD